MDHEETVVRVATIIALGVVLTVSVIGITIAAVFTDRDLTRAEVGTFAGVIVLAALGGITWRAFARRRHWRVNVERDEPEEEP